jgi:diguanylate cyclase
MLLFLTGLACGTVCLWIGLHLGKRLGHSAAAPSDSQTEQVRQWVGELSQWTSTFHRDVADYRQEMEGLTEQAHGMTQSAEPNRAAVAKQLMSQMLSANQRLQQRLNDAENRLHRQSEEMEGYLSEARTDGLTDLPNRRAFDEELARRLAEWRRYRMTFSIALLDVDHLDEINGRFGRKVGDRVLLEVARALRETMRDADLVCRFGGEEFAIVMPATCEPASFRAVERARKAVESIVIDLDGQRICATASCGAAQARDNDDAVTLLQQADAALYSSKCAGRNQSHWHDGVRCIPIEKASPAKAPANDDECVTECLTV